MPQVERLVIFYEKNQRSNIMSNGYLLTIIWCQVQLIYKLQHFFLHFHWLFVAMNYNIVYYRELFTAVIVFAKDTGKSKFE